MKHPDPSGQTPVPRFIADAMLGGLARWLRILGYDTLYDAHLAGADLVRQAHQDSRIVLTRDNSLPREWHLDTYLLVESTIPLMQVQQVVRQLRLTWQDHLFSRCLLCNTQLQPVAPRDVVSRVPPYVHQHQRKFMRCPTCTRIYWEGSHVTHMRYQLQQMLDANGL